jgi:hypothetical protein
MVQDLGFFVDPSDYETGEEEVTAISDLRDGLLPAETEEHLHHDHRAHSRVAILVPSTEAGTTCDGGCQMGKLALQVPCRTVLG